jgi:GT2 family glycosyltransferase/glycosyltransferase involved in cell wall biosynthesis
MPARKTTTSSLERDATRAVLFVHASGTHAVDLPWLEHVQSLGAEVFSHASLPGTHGTQHGLDEPQLLLGELAKAAPERPIVLLRAGLRLQAEHLDDLLALLDDPEAPQALTALSNSSPQYNPLAGLSADATPDGSSITAAVRVIGEPVLHEWPYWPEHLLVLSGTAANLLATGSFDHAQAAARLPGGIALPEWLFVADERAPAFRPLSLEPHESPRPVAWGTLSAHLQGWLDAGAPALNAPGRNGRAVTLHVTHSWGGGVSLWTESFIGADAGGDHLQLRSEQTQSGSGNGQKLSLYLGKETRFPIASWWLQPPILSVESQHDQYREALNETLNRFGVGRIMLSSLIGHSLDALRTGLPTVQVLHDYFPLWPLLSVHPDRYLTPGGVDLTAALKDHRGDLEFDDHGIEDWLAIREAYLEAVGNQRIHLVAPSQSVIDLYARLDPRWQGLEIKVIPHGLPPLRSGKQLSAKHRVDNKLRLLIPGRIQPGKGKALLLKALPGLTKHAQVYLIGTGKNGEDFFGLPGVSVILKYERDELAGLLDEIGPHLGALLSIVPETYSYTLSELQGFGLPVIATRCGSFAERIEDNITGWLIDPEPDALIEMVAKIARRPELLKSVSKGLSNLPGQKIAEMVGAYNTLCTPDEPPHLRPRKGLSLARAQSESARYQALYERGQLQQARQLNRGINQELARRSRWAEEADRAAGQARKHVQELEALVAERTAWAKEADRTAGQARKHVQELEALVAERTAWAGNLESQLVDAHAELAEMRSDLAAARSELAMTQSSLRQHQAELQALSQRQSETEAERQRLQDLQDMIVSSLSWRITRPLRVLRRSLRTAWQARIYNPARWHLLLSKLVRYLATQGVGGALRRLQSPVQGTAEKMTTRKPEAAERPETPAGRAASGTPGAGPEDSQAELALRFSRCESPRVSIVIPAFNQWAYTRQCLQSLRRAGASVPFEIILVDDASTDQTEQAMAQVEGVNYLRNPENLGFIGSCNRGSEQARGEFLVLLNNDTEVCQHWLDRLLETFAMVPEAGLVGAKLVYPDGTLQECGGMVLSDGSGWNYGRHDDPERPEYQFLRETDYCSGACIMLRTETFRRLGGFDTHYAPAYYEDTDLAFRIRQAGQKVLVQPAAVIVHHEGVTSGTDISSGTKQYQDINRGKFLERWAAALAEQAPPIHDPDDLSQVRAARDHHLKGRVLIIDATTPEPDQDSGSVRLTNLMQCFRDLGYGVTFFADNRVHAGRYTRELQQAGIEVLYLPWLDSLSEFFAQRGAEFDCVFISRHYIAVNYLSLVKRHCPQAPLIFDTVDLHYLREQRLAELEGSAALHQVARQTRRSELGIVAAADLTVVVSPAEVEVLAKDAPGARVHVLSNIHEVPGCRVGFRDRKDMVFIGGYQHPPNIDAATWFVRDIWPLVRSKLPEAKFHLIGSKATDEVRELAGDGVEFHGFVEDLEPWLDQCRLAVAPLRYGAGVKGKVNMSMSYGQPVVATPIAVEGMQAEDGREVLVAESAEDFASQVVSLYENEALWNRVSAAAIENVKTYFSLDAARASLATLLQSLPRKNTG